MVQSAFKLLYSDSFQSSGLTREVANVAKHLERGDLSGIEASKLSPSSFYGVKLNDSNHLLFKPVKYQDEIRFLLLEVVDGHSFETSRFLRGVTELIRPEPVVNFEGLQAANQDTLRYVDSANAQVHYLDRFIVFDADQSGIFHYPLPLILIGSAGSGKTSLVLEKLKVLTGDLLYVTLSSYLVHNARRLYYANSYENEHQSIDFLSFSELLETIQIPQGQEITPSIFLKWFERQGKSAVLKDSRKLYEEFRGVITGSHSDVPYLDRETYLNLGIRQSIYAPSERESAYSLFQKYLTFLKEEGYFDASILSYEYRQQVQPRYDAVIIDEVQDFTNSQLALILKTLKNPRQFLLCGDANQVVHPNFFSWSKLKSQFYQGEDLQTSDITRILTRNYRNTPEVTELANRVLKVKNARFGSIDKESHYLIESQATHKGQASCILSTPEHLKSLNDKIRRSTHYAVLVLTDAEKEEARQYFDTPLIFSVSEAKGLEYENVILYNVISAEPRYQSIAAGLDKSIFEKDFSYARAKDKADKSLEVYKFYINALYVAITRAINSVYLIESKITHPLLRLLDINEISNTLDIKASQSSLEEWQKEASRLAAQGKAEQAQEIEQSILKQKTPPWKPIDEEQIQTLQKKFFVEKTSTKQEKLFLLEYAMLYSNQRLQFWLKRDGVNAAQNISKSRPIMEEKYFGGYQYKSFGQVRSDIAQYGLEFRNLMNFTPLMGAAYCGNEALIQELIALGSSIESRDANFRTAFQIALSRGFEDPKFSHNKLPGVYRLLQTDSLSLNVDGQLIKIDSSRAEYFLLNVLLLFYKDLLHPHLLPLVRYGFTAAQVEQLVGKYADSIWQGYRKKRQYLSSLLSRNEVNSKYIPNRKLFVRHRRGYYQINPNIQLKTASGWIPITQICDVNPEDLAFSHDFNRDNAETFWKEYDQKFHILE